MMLHYLPGNYSVWLLGLFIVAAVYWLLIPRPLPGIPYHKPSAWTIGGDIRRRVRSAQEHRTDLVFLSQQAQELKSPISQLLGPRFVPPVVLISDYHEAEDILSRRTKEFDRSENVGKTFDSLIGDSTLVMPSNHRFKLQRRLWARAMTSDFLNRVASKWIYSSTLDLVQLWRKKAALAEERPFEAQADLARMTFDSIRDYLFGQKLGSTKSQLDFLEGLEDAGVEEQMSVMGDVVVIPSREPPETYQTFKRLMGYIENAKSSPLSEFKWWYTQKTESFRQDAARRDAEMSGLIEESRRVFSRTAHGAESSRANSAINQILSHEDISNMTNLLADAEDVDKYLKDEMLLLLFAGYDTTWSSIAWALKLLTVNQDKQNCLYGALRAAFPKSRYESLPMAEDILKTDVPYLDATCAEVLRVSQLAPVVTRQATRDTTVAGYPIAKGTFLMILTNGAAFSDTGEAESAPYGKEKSGARDINGERGRPGSWPSEDRQQFKPERWLQRVTVTREDGLETQKVIYNDKAGPSMPFSVGPRSCFGKRFAEMAMKLAVALIAMSFEILSIEGLQGEDGKGKAIDLDSWDVTEYSARAPVRTYIRIRPR